MNEGHVGDEIWVLQVEEVLGHCDAMSEANRERGLDEG